MAHLALLILLGGSPMAQGQVALNAAAENQAIRLKLNSYALRQEKLGDPAPKGHRFLVIRGSLTNKNQQKGVSIPPVEKAFTLRVNGETMIELDPISEDTADPFWGPMILRQGEERPIEMVFAVPAEGLESAELRHLSDQGPMSIYVIGVAPEISTDYLAGPVSMGQSQLAVSSVSAQSSHEGRPAPPGQQFLRVNYWFTNLMELHPLETNIASLSTLVEDGGYLYQPLSSPKKGERVEVERFYAQEPTAGKMVFLIPSQHGDLALVHFTESGPIHLDLTPDRPNVSLPQAIAGPTRSGRIVTSIYGVRPSADGAGLIIDVGLSLNMNDPLADLPIDLLRAFELHEVSGQFRKADATVQGMRRPLGHVVVRRDQVARGEVAFRGTLHGSGQTLVLPLASGHIRLDMPAGRTAQRVQQPQSTSEGGGIGALLGAASLQPGGAQAAGAGYQGARQRGPDQLDQRAYRQYDRQPDPRIEALLAEADRLIRQRKLTTPRGASAVDRLDEVLLLDPYNPFVIQMFADIYRTYVDWALTAMQRHQYGQAARYADQALAVLGRDRSWFGVPQAEVAGLYFIRGEALAVQGQPAAARSAYLRALTLKPDFEDARLALDQLDTAPPPAQPSPAAPAPPAQPSGPGEAPDSVNGIPDVLDTGTLSINRVIVRLYGVEGAYEPYITTLEEYISDREVSCTRHDGEAFKCLLGDVDLSELVLLNGAGRSTPEAPENLKQAQANARERGVGIWR